MIHYDHALVGATLAVAVGVQTRHGWPAVVLAALAGMFPDWDAITKHISPETYQVGHRVWGHNLFAVTFAGVALGALGYLIHRSQPSHKTDPGGPGPWNAISVAIMWTHPLLDLLYCGRERDVDWPVRLLWPVLPDGFARPWMPWTDWGATALLVSGMLVWILARHHRQACAALSLMVLLLYVGIRGALLQTG